MNDREDRLMDYLYGEMEEPDRRKFEAELDRDPELQAELQALRNTRSILSGLPDVQPQPVVAVMKSRPLSWKKWPFRVGGAAAVLLLLFLFNARFEVSSRGFVFSLGKTGDRKEMPQAENNALADLQDQMTDRDRTLQKQLLQMDSVWTHRLLTRDSDLEQAWKRQFADYREFQRAEMERFAVEFREKEITELAGLLQTLQLRQQEEIQLIMANFWDHWQQTRAADLQSIESEFANLYQSGAFDD